MELICINDTYSSEVLNYFKKYNIKYPKKDEMVEFLRLVKSSVNNKVGIVVKPYENQMVKIMHPFGVEGLIEQSFDINRFAKLNGDLMSEEEVKQIEYDKQML